VYEEKQTCRYSRYKELVSIAEPRKKSLAKAILSWYQYSRAGDKTKLVMDIKNKKKKNENKIPYNLS
jgi:hypothetical protein